MANRSYEYWQVRSDMGSDATVICQGDEQRCRTWYREQLPYAQTSKQRMYLVRTTVVEVFKPDGDDNVTP